MALVPGKTVAQMAGESVTQDADLFYFLRGSNDFGITFVDLQTQFMGGITIEAGSQNYLGWNPATSELSMKALAITDVTVDATEISLAAYLAANYTVGDEHQEGDVIYLTAATGGTEAYIHNGGTAVTAADFEIINFPVITSLTGLTDTASASVNDGFLQWNAGGTQVEYVANIGEIYGGTGQNSYATGDMLYASGANTLTKLAAGSNTEVLTLAGGVPTWAAIVASDLNSVLTAGNTSGANDINLDKTGTAISAASQVGSQGLHFHSSIWDGVVEVDRKFTMRSLPMIAAFDAEDDSLVWQYEGDNKMTLQVSQTGAQTLYVSDEQRPTDGSSGGFSSIGKGAILASGSVTYIQLQGTGTGAGNLSVDRWDALGGNFSTLNFRTGTTIRMKMSAAGIKIENGLSGGLDPSARLARWHVMGAASGGDQTPLLVQITGAVDALKVDTLAKTIFTVPTTGTASINLPHGVEPTVPVNGDIWTTTAGTFARVNGVTVDLTDTGVVSGDGIYDGSGSLSGDVVVTMGNNDLQFNSTGLSNVMNINGTNGDVHFLADKILFDGSTSRLTFSTTPATFGSSTGADSSVLRVKNDANLNTVFSSATLANGFNAVFLETNANYIGTSNAGLSAAGLVVGNEGGHAAIMRVYDSSDNQIFQVDNTGDVNIFGGFGQLGVGAFASDAIQAHIAGQATGATIPLRVDTSAVDNALLVKADSGVQMGGAPTVAGKFTMQGFIGSHCLVINTDSTSSSVRGIRIFDSASSELFKVDSTGDGFIRDTWVIGKSDLTTSGLLRVYNPSLSGGTKLVQVITPAGARFELSATGEFSMFGRVQIGDQTTTLAAEGGLGIKAIGGASPTARALRIQNSVGLELFNVSTTGNVGIGVLSPTERFEIASGTAKFAASTAAAGSIIIPHGVHVSNTFQDGEVWTTTLGMFARINGVTVDLTDTGVASGDGIYDGSGSLTAGATAVTMSTTDTLTFGTDALHIDFNSGTQRVAMNHTSFEGSETLRVNGNVVFNGDLELNSTGGNAIEQYRQLKTEVSVEILNKQYLNNSADAKTLYAQQGVSIIDNTAGTEDGRYVLSVMKNGTLSNMMDFQGGGIGVNTVPFASTQFHIDSATGYDALHVEVVGNTRFIVDSDGLTGVNIATPLAQLHVKGRSSGTGSTPLRVDTSAIDNALTVGSNANTGFGLSPAASRRVQIQGETATSGTYSMYVTDSASGDLFTIRNDGYSAFGRTPSSVARLITKGKGTTSTTASFISKNSADTDTLRIGDDGTIDMYNELTLTLSTDSDLRSTFSNPSVGTSARSSLDVNNGTSNLFHEIYSTLYTNTYIRNKGVIRANSQSDGIVINSGNNISGTIELGVSTSANNLTTATTALFINTNRTVHIGNGVGAPDASAVLEISGSTGGVVVPRMAAATASLISSPIDGNILYVTTTDGTFTSVGIWAREAGTWIKL